MCLTEREKEEGSAYIVKGQENGRRDIRQRQIGQTFGNFSLNQQHIAC